MTWRALRQRTQTDIRSLTAMREKRDLHLLVKPALAPPPKGEAATTEPKSEIKDEMEDVEETHVAVKEEDGSVTVDPIVVDVAEVEVVTESEEKPDTAVETDADVDAADAGVVVGVPETETAEDLIDAKIVSEEQVPEVKEVDETVVDEGTEIVVSTEVEEETGAMDVDRPATPEAPELDKEVEET